MAMLNLTTTTRKIPLHFLAPILVLLGVFGLIWALDSSRPPKATNGPSSSLQVQSAGSASTQQSQTGAAGQLQGAVKSKQFINGRDANTLQQGASIDSMMTDADLR